MRNKTILFAFLALFGLKTSVSAQQNKALTAGKPISPDLFGVFFEDLSYAADGGLYAELVQNRSFEYTLTDKDGWTKDLSWGPFKAWQYLSRGYGYGNISIESAAPIHPNNPHYVVLMVEEAGKEGVGLSNSGFDGIAVKEGQHYNFSAFAKQLSAEAIPFEVRLHSKKGELIGKFLFQANSKAWKKYAGSITVNKTDDSCSLEIVALVKCKAALDEISLFPQNTFKNQVNGLRADLAQTIAALQPKFMRFPGGCLVHGDGLGNMYRWKNTIGPVEERIEQRNIWNYHQSVGLGFYEYFRFCEDIGAKPLPVVAAGVSCQNSGGTWRTGGDGQKALALADMAAYVQDVLDLIEYANGPITSTWGAKRALAGHPQSFHLQYIGIGNEDKQTDDFRERFKMIYDAVRAKHPEITIIGTVGPFPSGEDYDLGWKLANQLNIPVVDEHFYEKPKWFLDNNGRYDNYKKTGSQVYIGEYASQGNTLANALAEAAFMTSIERNGDVVKMASYAPLLANTKHTSWNPNLVYFNNTSVAPTVNYYVQQLFSANQGDHYYAGVISFKGDTASKNTELAASCVKDSKTGDLILKIVNAGPASAKVQTNLSRFDVVKNAASLSVLTGDAKEKNTMEQPQKIVPVVSAINFQDLTQYEAPPYSLSVIRIKSKSH